MNPKGDRVEKDGNVKHYELGTSFSSPFLLCPKLLVCNSSEGPLIGVGCEIVRW